MRKLGEFVVNEFNTGKTKSLINEYRTPGSKNKKVEMDDIEGKSAEKNGTDGQFAVNEPKDDKAQKVEIDKDALNKNMKRLLMKFKTEEDFFIIGKAGWGKTSIIKDLAKKFNREVVTFYLDKAEGTDLGGIPVPTQDKNGKGKQELLLPPFAQILADNPDKKFLLFFDEMNQAAPDVMNALMPIVLEHEIAGRKFDNFFVGAAGNFESENGAVNELSGPLKSRFKPIIVWETGGDAWKGAFHHLHKIWDEKLGKKLVDRFEENAEMFDNPREVEQKIFRFIERMKNDDDKDYLDAEDYLERLQGLVKEDLTRTQEAELSKLAEDVYKFINNKEEKEKENGGGRASRKADINMIPKNLLEAIKKGMTQGYISVDENGKQVKYGISRENINSIDESELNGEMMERLINKLEADGLKFKFEKDEEWKKAGYKDPNED